MAALKPAATATLSTKGQLTLPKAVRESRGWDAGTHLEIEEQGDVLVVREKATPAFARTRMEDVYGMFPRKGPVVTHDEMRQGAAEGAAERYRRSFEPDDGA